VSSLGLHSAHARVIVEFDLSSAEPEDDAPAMGLCEFKELLLRYITENPQLRGLGDDVLGADGKSLPDFGGESWQIVMHLSPASRQLDDLWWKFFSSMAVVAAAWVYGSIWPLRREQPCGQAKGHVCLVSPYHFARCGGVCIKRLSSEFGAWHKRDHTGALARGFSVATL
jgi:hypothetical protein